MIMSVQIDPAQVEQLQQRMKEVRKLLEDNKVGEAAVEMQDIRSKALQIYQDELAYEMAEYYYLMGYVLVSKIETSQELFGQTVQQAEEKILQNEEEEEEELELEQDSVDANGKPVQEEPNQQQAATQENNTEEKAKEEVDGDFQVAWENLETARTILEKSLKQETEKPDQDQQRQTYLSRHLAKVYSRKAELEMWRDNFVAALEDHNRALELRLAVEDVEKSRDIAESYYLIGTIHDYNYQPGQDCESKSLFNYKKALQILENNLSDLLKLPKRDVSQIDKETPTTNHLNISFLDTEDSKELKYLIKRIYEKIEDLKLQQAQTQSEEYKRLQKELQEQKNQDSQVFSQPKLQNAPVVNLGKFGNAKKNEQPAQAPQNNKNAENQVEEGLEPSPSKKLKEA